MKAPLAAQSVYQSPPPIPADVGTRLVSLLSRRLAENGPNATVASLLTDGKLELSYPLRELGLGGMTISIRHARVLADTFASFLKPHLGDLARPHTVTVRLYPKDGVLFWADWSRPASAPALPLTPTDVRWSAKEGLALLSLELERSFHHALRLYHAHQAPADVLATPGTLKLSLPKLFTDGGISERKLLVDALGELQKKIGQALTCEIRPADPEGRFNALVLRWGGAPKTSEPSRTKGLNPEDAWARSTSRRARTKFK